MTCHQLATLVRDSVVGKAQPQINFANDFADHLDRNSPDADTSTLAPEAYDFLLWLVIIFCWGTF